MNPEPEAFMSTDEILAWQAYQSPPTAEQRKQPLIQRLQESGHWHRHQLGGRRWAMGCVSLEITQRCNLDCTLCYLSDHSEAVHDIPLVEVYRRIDEIYRHYGPFTDVQVSGGDPTLRKRADLIAIVKRIAALNMRPSLFTNGILASRDLLRALSDNGLNDVAFHVDLTQERKGYATESALNVIREDYLNRCRGLPISVFFNTTVFAGNFHEIPDVVAFFRRHAGRVKLASFQLQADSGRGVLRERDYMITQESVWAKIEQGAGLKLPCDSPVIGHPKCNKYAFLFAANGHLYNAWEDGDFVMDLISRSDAVQFDRKSGAKAVLAAITLWLRAPKLWRRGLVWLGRLVWRMKWDILKNGGKVDKISFFMHNFMDAGKLEQERIHNCVFMVATSDGPLSMCMHNAKRDQYILKPQRIGAGDGERLWNPLTGKLEDSIREAVANSPEIAHLPRKKRKGRVKIALLAEPVRS